MLPTKKLRSFRGLGRWLVLGLSIAVSAPAATYYLDSVAGNDGNSGTSTSTAWKTLAKLNTRTFVAGDNILFKSGQSFSGQWIAQGSGASGNPIQADIYGGTARAVLNGGGADNGTIYALNVQYWEFRNLEITNSSTSASTYDFGILVKGTNGGTLNHFVIAGCSLHDVSGVAAISVESPDVVGQRTKFNDVLIDNNTVADVAERAIRVWNNYYFNNNGLTENTPSGLWSNVVISNNTVMNTGRQGIIMCGTIGGVIENNIVALPSQNGSGGGMFIESTRNALIQYNEVYGNLRNAGDADAHGIGVDKDTFDSVTQYNYVHDNDESGIVLFSDGTDKLVNAVVRYNISQGNGDGEVQMLGPITSASIYNNTFLTFSGTTVNMIKTDSWNGYPISVSWRNNIFNLGSSGGYDIQGTQTFSHNVFYPNHPANEPADANKITSTPLFISAGSGGDGRNTADGYRIAPGSVLLSSANFGTFISGNGGKDYWGNSVSTSAASMRGAYNGPGIVGTAPNYETSRLRTTRNASPYIFYNDTGASGTIAVLDASAAGDYVEYNVVVNTAGTYNVSFRTKKKNDRGIVQLAINGANQGGAQDLYTNSATGSYVTLALGTKTLGVGTHLFRFTVTGKNAASSDYKVPVDYITLN